MKSARRTVTIVIALAIVSCALIVTLRVFAEASAARAGTTFILNIDGDQRAKLKSDYANNDNYDNFDALLNTKCQHCDLVDHKGKHHKKDRSLSSLRPAS